MAAFLPPARAETLDKVVASVGYNAITQREVVEEFHFEQFLNGQSPSGTPSGADRKSVINRLIRQTLLKEQMRASGKSWKSDSKAAKQTLASVRKKFPSESAYQAALQKLGMSEQQVLEKLEAYQRTLEMINNRLRPAALPNPSAVEEYYKTTFVPEYARDHKGSPPPLDDVRDQIREVLIQKKMNQLLGDWLERLKSNHRVIIHSY